MGTYICLDCQKKLNYLKHDNCLYCGKRSSFGLTHESCKKKYGIDGCMSIFYYNDFLKKLIKAIKYRLAEEVFEELCLVIKPAGLYKLSCLKKINGPFFVQPIPLHDQKLRERGFNQSYLLARFLNSFLDFKIVDDLIRKKSTSAQAQLGKRRERYLNLRGAFKIKEKHIFKKYILVDDVLTTGITLTQAAEVLKKAGAEAIFALSLAKG